MNKGNGIGDQYHLMTKYHPDRMTGGGMRWDEMPDTYKTYPDAETVKLPEPVISAGKFIWDVLSQRRSRRNYSDVSLSMKELSQMLWATQGVTAQSGRYAFRTAPSAGALYPIETYVLVNRVKDLEAGIYHYDILNHKLEVLKKGDFGMKISQAALGQTMLNEAAFVFIWTAVVARSKWKYRERAYRYIYMDAGHIGQNAYLAAETLGLGCCTVGAFFDEAVDSIIGIDGKNEISVYLCSVGKKSVF
jgi:SagB-type dehydrogenase family enzyme